MLIFQKDKNNTNYYVLEFSNYYIFLLNPHVQFKSFVTHSFTGFLNLKIFTQCNFYT